MTKKEISSTKVISVPQALEIISSQMPFDGDEQRAFDKSVKKLTKGKLENIVVLSIILKEIRTMKKGHIVRFDLGAKKEWSIKRVK